MLGPEALYYNLQNLETFKVPYSRQRDRHSSNAFVFSTKKKLSGHERTWRNLKRIFLSKTKFGKAACYGTPTPVIQNNHYGGSERMRERESE